MKGHNIRHMCARLELDSRNVNVLKTAEESVLGGWVRYHNRSSRKTLFRLNLIKKFIIQTELVLLKHPSIINL